MMRKIRELNKKLRDGKKLVAEDHPNASFIERRSDLKDRRKLQTFIMNDRRNGIVDRRNKIRAEI